MASERILIVGGPGSGKTTFARRVADATGIPIHHLDLVARVGGGTGRVRSGEERAADVAAIVASGRWIAEGVHLGWTEPLFEAADTIVWLDHVPWTSSGRRMVRRFIAQAVHEARTRRGRDRFLRFGDYARRLRDLARAIPEARGYERGYERGGTSADAAPTRAATEAALSGHSPKVIHVQASADVETAFRTLCDTKAA